MIRKLSISKLIDLSPKMGLVLFRNGIIISNDTSEQSLEFYCEFAKLDIDKIEKQIEGLIGEETDFNPESFSMRQIVQYLTQTHHEYAKIKLPAIRKMMENLFLEKYLDQKHVVNLCSAFEHFEKHLNQHIAFEENEVFPFIVSMIDAAQKGNFTPSLLSYLKRLSISKIMSQHAGEEDDMHEIKEATGYFSVDENDPLSYKVTVWALQDLEMDLHRHNGLEDTHLFPQAQMLEEYLLKKAQQISSLN